MTWEHKGITARVTDRRRYGTTTYTWVTFTDGEREATPDPWPCIRPAAAEVRAECARLAEMWSRTTTSDLTDRDRVSQGGDYWDHVVDEAQR